MTRHVLTAEDQRKAVLAAADARDLRREFQKMRREAELALLDKLYAELAMPEWYPHQ